MEPTPSAFQSAATTEATQSSVVFIRTGGGGEVRGQPFHNSDLKKPPGSCGCRPGSPLTSDPSLGLLRVLPLTLGGAVWPPSTSCWDLQV